MKTGFPIIEKKIFSVRMRAQENPVLVTGNMFSFVLLRLGSLRNCWKSFLFASCLSYGKTGFGFSKANVHFLCFYVEESKFIKLRVVSKDLPSLKVSFSH